MLERKILHFLVEMIGGNVDVKGASDEMSEGNEKHVIGNWGKGDPCF